MPFEGGGARSFTSTSIQNNAPDRSGVYGLCNSRHWVFIGEAADIRASLLNHLHKASAFPSNGQPTGFVFETCAGMERGRRRDKLIREFKPLVRE